VDQIGLFLLQSEHTTSVKEFICANPTDGIKIKALKNNILIIFIGNIKIYSRSPNFSSQPVRSHRRRQLAVVAFDHGSRVALPDSCILIILST
jgi:hypothetical protein